MNHLFILDNGGETFDRYTIVNTKDGEMIGASENPFSPLGFGQHCGNVADNYWITAYGHAWNRSIPQTMLKNRIKYAIDHFKENSQHVGHPIKFEDLPVDVQKFAVQYFTV